MEIPDEILKEIRESGYDQELVYNYIRKLLKSDKQINENNNLELIDNYLLDKRFMRELEDNKEYDAAWLDKVPIFSYLFKGYSFEQITGLKKWWNLQSFSYQLSLHLYGLFSLG